MATTYNFTDGSIPRVPKPHDTTPRGFEIFILRNLIDSTQQSLTTAASDIAQVLTIPAKTLVLGCFINVRTAEGTGSSDIDLGTGTDSIRWGDGISLDSTGVVESTLSFGAPLYFASADTIDVECEGSAADIDSAIFEVIAVCVNCGHASIDAGDVQYTAQS